MGYSTQPDFDMFVVLISILGFITLCIGIVFQTVWRERKMKKMLTLAAKRLRAEMVGKAMGHPDLRFEHAGCQATLKFFKRSKPRKVRFSVLVFSLPASSPLDLHLRTQGLASEFAGQAAGEESSTGQASLDRELALRTTDPALARRIFSPETARALERIRKIDRKGRLELFVHGREMVIQLPTYPSRSEQVLGMALMGNKILEALLSATGIRAANPQAEIDGATEECYGCQEPIASDGRLCPFCSTAFHGECWQHLAACPACAAPTAKPAG